jgi:uncharacterized protein YjbI with pentapeptide repeats
VANGRVPEDGRVRESVRVEFVEHESAACDPAIFEGRASSATRAGFFFWCGLFARSPLENAAACRIVDGGLLLDMLQRFPLGAELLGAEFFGAEFFGAEFLGAEFLGAEFFGAEFASGELAADGSGGKC